MRSFKTFGRIMTALSLTVIMCLNSAMIVMADEEDFTVEVEDTEEQPEETESEETSSEETDLTDETMPETETGEEIPGEFPEETETSDDIEITVPEDTDIVEITEETTEEPEDIITIEEETESFSFEAVNDAVVEDGWHQEGNYWYYYQDGVKLKGWQVIEGETYYFGSSDNHRMTGWVWIGPEAGRLFYFDYQGRMLHGGWSDGSALGTGYYFYDDGRAALGLQEIDGNYYYFNTNTGRVNTGWIYINNGRAYADDNGKIVNGWRKIENYWYYFDPESFHFVTGWQLIDEVYYFFSNWGEMYTGWHRIDGKMYYFRKSGAYVSSKNLTSLFDSAYIEADAINNGAHRCYMNLDYDYENNCSVVMFEGTFDNSCYEYIAEINRYRLEACRNGYPDPRDPSRSLTVDDYVPIRWSRDMEEQAMANAAVSYNFHNHSWLWSGRMYSDLSPCNESLAFCGRGAAARAWYTERDIWVNGGSGVTGHYTSMINPGITHVGIAGFTANGSSYTYCAEFYGTMGEAVNESKLDVSGFNGQLEVFNVDYISNVEISTGNLPLYNGNTIQLQARCSLTLYDYTRTQKGPFSNIRVLPSTWWSGNESIISVDRAGYATALRTGTCKVYCKVGGKTYSLSVTVSAAPTGWQQINDIWYHFNSNGIADTGWKKIGSKWYYFNKDHAMLTGWQKIGSAWYYLNDDGSMATSWKLIGSSWYYFGSSGAMQTDWKKIGTKWYYFGGSGVMRTGWQKVSGIWYYFESSGAMKTGWLSLDGKWYYFESSGAMVTGTRTIGGRSYSFDSSGICTNP